MNNKKLGNSFEKEMTEILSKKGYWVTMLTPKQHIGSQPADLIAIKDNKPILIDCKTCKTKYFQISRIEQNQWSAYERYKKCGNTSFILAIKYDEDIYIVPLDNIDKSKKSINLKKGDNQWKKYGKILKDMRDYIKLVI